MTECRAGEIRLAGLAALILVVGGSLLAAQELHVGPNVHISASLPRLAHSESLLAADPGDPRNLLACVMVTVPEKDGSSSFVYASFDGGRSWERTLDFDRGMYTGDPACTYGLGETAFFTAIGLDRAPDGEWVYKIFTHRSENKGRTWRLVSELPFRDREYVAVDRTNGPRRGRLYLHGQAGVRSLDGGEWRSSGLELFHSIDGGATYRSSGKYASTGTQGVHGLGNSVVLSDGTVVILVGQYLVSARSGERATPGSPNAVLKVVYSRDGGESLAPAVKVADWHRPAQRTENIVPVIAVDAGSGAFRDRLYVVWPDVRSGWSRILISHSSDLGRTWSEPLPVDDTPWRSDDGAGPDNFMPAVAVNPAGVVGVAWLDRRDHPDNRGWTARFSASFDGGETFVPSVATSTSSHSADPTTGVLPLETRVRGAGSGKLTVDVYRDIFFFNRGDTSGLAAGADGRFHPLWIDNRTGVPQLWTAPVTPTGGVFANGSPDLAELEDLTGVVRIDVESPRYDHATETMSMALRVFNGSDRVLRAPLEVRALALESPLGQVEVLNASNGARGRGATWNLAGAMPGGKVKPASRTTPTPIALRVARTRVSALSDNPGSLLQLHLKVLGSREPKTP